MPIYLILMAVIVAIDQFVKYYVVTHIALNTAVNAIPHFLSLAYIRNYGAAWSILIGQRWFFFIISIVALVILGYAFKRKHQNILYAVSISLMIGGTIGNFIDRIHLGYVIDMFQLEFINFPIFNVADCALTVGVIILLIAMAKDDTL
ncbi:signal peptidase II [Ligilactobacillus ceti]|uniref:Lipoprotein signal peptidase n=1 Tax=Ligilactobacillus ceti DSM 22408 TaxID=1122146 RepID=A0A0R2KRN9_9LACO|nr:signal peptidase II [Ligilactobacillus ceti]KRN88845.1 signal peptidase II [Ligilactobacillus ceti DSM 22408]